MPPAPLAILREEVRSLYAPPQRAPKTWYVLRQVLDELAELEVRTTDQITPALLSRWIAEHDDRSAATNKKLLGGLRAVCNYAHYMGYLDRTPFGYRKHWVRTPKARAKKHHSAEAISSVLSMLESERREGWDSHRLFALVSLYAYTGLRKLEALHAKVEDFHLADGYLDLVARRPFKTPESEALVPLPQRLIETLAEWLPKTGSEWAFPHKLRTGPWTEGRVGHKPLDQVKLAGDRAGVEGFTIQSLRHSWATHAESLWDLGDGVIKRVLRHTNLRTQANYRHADLVNLRAQVRSIAFVHYPGSQGREGVKDGQETALSA